MELHRRQPQHSGIVDHNGDRQRHSLFHIDWTRLLSYQWIIADAGRTDLSAADGYEF